MYAVENPSRSISSIYLATWLYIGATLVNVVGAVVIAGTLVIAGLRGSSRLGKSVYSKSE